MYHTVSDIVDRRASVATQWAAHMEQFSALGDSRIPMEIPSCFVDRFAFAACLAEDTGNTVDPAVPGFDLEWALQTAEAALETSLRPTQSLAGWVADPDAVVTLSEFYQELRGRWSNFASRSGLPPRLWVLPDRTGRTWREIFADTIFYPRAPVIAGPNFFDVLSEQDRTDAISRFGPRCPIDFFCFMQQVHETVHRHQTGEPVLNEVVQASIWLAFLDSEALWVLQRNSQTGRACPLEASVVEAHPTLFEWALRAGLDTAALADWFSPSAYHLLCLWARTFERTVRYRQYLDGLSTILSRRNDDRFVVRQIQAIECPAQGPGPVATLPEAGVLRRARARRRWSPASFFRRPGGNYAPRRTPPEFS